MESTSGLHQSAYQGQAQYQNYSNMGMSSENAISNSVTQRPVAMAINPLANMTTQSQRPEQTAMGLGSSSVGQNAGTSTLAPANRTSSTQIYRPEVSRTSTVTYAEAGHGGSAVPTPFVASQPSTYTTTTTTYGNRMAYDAGREGSVSQSQPQNSTLTQNSYTYSAQQPKTSIQHQYANQSQYVKQPQYVTQQGSTSQQGYSTGLLASPLTSHSASKGKLASPGFIRAPRPHQDLTSGYAGTIDPCQQTLAFTTVTYAKATPGKHDEDLAKRLPVGRSTTARSQYMTQQPIPTATKKLCFCC